ncbi:MAG: hypothetical protein HYS35_02360 [Betaproteobacteria bacterium]|nr:hypothetical protein [Betaproteobacteria bacterium]
MALIALLAVIALGASWFLVSRLNDESNVVTAIWRTRNAEALNRAKLALIGYVAQQAARSGENDPGALPCPEPAGYYGDPANEGVASGNCSLPAVGRLPWRTLGLDKLVDAAGEPLWYVVANGWAKPSSTTNTVINSNCAGYDAASTQACRSGRLAVDGVTSDVIALIIAPGPAFSVAAATGCSAISQARPTSGTPDRRNYLECENATYPTADSIFVTTGPSGSFNDQVVRITAAEILPGIEAAIANRIEREIVPLLSAVYADALWGTSSTNPAFALPAAFANPATSGFLGQAGLTQGLVPFNYHAASCGGNVRCSSNAISWGATPSLSTSGGPGYLPLAPTCYVSGGAPVCEGYYYGGTLNISMTDPAAGITTGLRTWSGTGHGASYQSWRWNGSSWVYLGVQSGSVSRSLSSSGAANFVAGASLPSVPDWGYFYITATRPGDGQFSDHALLDSSTASSTGWFARNEWYRQIYYAMAPNHAPGGTLSCTSGGTCLQVTNLTDASKQRAVLALAGRALSALSQTQPSGNLQDYLDSAENRNLDSIFVQSPVGSSFNDRFISLSKNP